MALLRQFARILAGDDGGAPEKPSPAVDDLSGTRQRLTEYERRRSLLEAELASYRLPAT